MRVSLILAFLLVLSPLSPVSFHTHLRNRAHTHTQPKDTRLNERFFPIREEQAVFPFVPSLVLSSNTTESTQNRVSSFCTQRSLETEMESEIKRSKFRRICVFCGSSQGKKSSYHDAAIELGKELVILRFFFILGVFGWCLLGVLVYAWTKDTGDFGGVNAPFHVEFASSVGCVCAN